MRKKKIKMQPKSKTLNVTKLRNSKCDKTKNWDNSKWDKTQKLKIRQSSKTKNYKSKKNSKTKENQIVKLISLNCEEKNSETKL